MLCLFFFKCSLNKRAVTLILILDEGNATTLVQFEFQSSGSKNEQFFEKNKHYFHCSISQYCTVHCNTLQLIELNCITLHYIADKSTAKYQEYILIK